MLSRERELGILPGRGNNMCKGPEAGGSMGPIHGTRRNAVRIERCDPTPLQAPPRPPHTLSSGSGPQWPPLTYQADTCYSTSGSSHRSILSVGMSFQAPERRGVTQPGRGKGRTAISMATPGLSYLTPISPSCGLQVFGPLPAAALLTWGLLPLRGR